MNTAAAAAEVIPTVPGTPFAGGFFVDRMIVNGVVYALVSAGAAGELEKQQWNGSTKSVEGARSYNDGLANTDAMAAAGSELAKRARESRIADLDDWYLPSRLEALMVHCVLQPALVDGPDAFPEEWHWTSTQPESASGYAWIQSFGWGFQDFIRKSVHFRARLVRRVAI